MYANPLYYEEWIRDVTSIPADPPAPPVTPFDPCPCTEYKIDDDVLLMDSNDSSTFQTFSSETKTLKQNGDNQWTYSAPGLSELYSVEIYYDQER